MSEDIYKGIVKKDASEENVMKIMHMIVLNQISNVRYYITNIIKIKPTNFYSTIDDIEKKYLKLIIPLLLISSNKINTPCSSKIIFNLIIYVPSLFHYQ